MLKEFLIFALGAIVGSRKGSLGWLIVLGLVAYMAIAVMAAVSFMIELFVILPLKMLNKVLRRILRGM